MIYLNVFEFICILIVTLYFAIFLIVIAGWGINKILDFRQQYNCKIRKKNLIKAIHRLKEEEEERILLQEYDDIHIGYIDPRKEYGI